VKICLLGAESTGKTALAQALVAHYQAQGKTAAIVPEVLRAWCARAGRMPRPEELLPIAREQEMHVDEAARGAAIVIADTNALMVAIWGGMLFEDTELYRFALERQRRYDATLVMGLDLPWVQDGLQRQGPEAREPVDSLVRGALERAGIAYRVVYGRGDERLASALLALGHSKPDGDVRERPWMWSCDKCSDPACEHRLFTGLLGRAPESDNG
jgi:nicotinamide riboside kinase